MKEKLKTAVKKAEIEIEKIEEIIGDELRPREDSTFTDSVPHETKVGELDEHGHLIRPEKAPEHF